MLGVTTVREFYELMKENHEEFLQSPRSPRCATNAAITCFHMADWLWAGWIKRDCGFRAKQSVESQQAFLKWIDGQCPWFRLVQEIANGMKHLGRKCDFDGTAVLGYGMGGYGIGPFGESYLVIDLGSDNSTNRLIPVANLLQTVVEFWDWFMTEHGPP